MTARPSITPLTYVQAGRECLGFILARGKLGAVEHSRKPDEAYELIERMYPELPKIELFARSAREGWAAWGNQVPAEAPVPDDDLDIPEFLRREPKAAAS